LNIALNNTSGEFDDEMLRVLVKRVERDQEITASEALSTGFTQRQIEALIAPVKVSEDGDNLPFASSVTLSLAFDSVSERDAVKGLLAELAVGASKKTGTIVRELLEARASSNRKKAQI
jgi:hypothetical protein